MPRGSDEPPLSRDKDYPDNADRLAMSRGGGIQWDFIRSSVGQGRLAAILDVGSDRWDKRDWHSRNKLVVLVPTKV